MSEWYEIEVPEIDIEVEKNLIEILVATNHNGNIWIEIPLPEMVKALKDKGVI